MVTGKEKQEEDVLLVEDLRENRMGDTKMVGFFETMVNTLENFMDGSIRSKLGANYSSICVVPRVKQIMSLKKLDAAEFPRNDFLSPAQQK